MRGWLIRALAALALVSAFFYPLAAAVDSQIFYLHWQPRHTLELAAAYAGLSLIVAMLLALLDRVRSDRLAASGFAALAVVPLTSLAGGLLRAYPIKEVLAPFAASWRVRLLIVAGAGAVALLGFAMPKRTRWVIRHLPLALSPVIVIVMASLGTLISYRSGPASLTHEETTPGTHRDAPRVLVLLFDELSFHALYEEGDIRPAYPNLRAFGAHATHYHQALAPGSETSVSLPGYLLDRPIKDTDVAGDAFMEVLSDGSRAPLDISGEANLFGDLKAQGWRTEMFGWYLPYCRMLATSLDRCEAFSLYNASTVSNGFSPLAPIRTTLILWPYQFPSGLLKNPAFSAHQRALTARLEAAAESTWAEGSATLRFVHFSVPHVPFVFNRNGYDPPFEPVTPRLDLYERQLAYVDTLFGRVMSRLATQGTDRVTVVVLSDHEFRAQAPASEWPHVPVIVRRPNQKDREDIREPVSAGRILRAAIAGSAQP